LAISHFLKFSKSEFTTASDLCRQQTNGKSFTYSKKNSGPKIEPCGTPHLIHRSDEKEFFI
jgi:hypothetical protein